MLSPLDVMIFLVRASILLNEGVAPTLLQLLQSALCGSKSEDDSNGGKSSVTGSPGKPKKDKDKDKNDQGIHFNLNNSENKTCTTHISINVHYLYMYVNI